jgi:hypothetical protein
VDSERLAAGIVGILPAKRRQGWRLIRREHFHTFVVNKVHGI